MRENRRVIILIIIMVLVAAAGVGLVVSTTKAAQTLQVEHQVLVVINREASYQSERMVEVYTDDDEYTSKDEEIQERATRL